MPAIAKLFRAAKGRPAAIHTIFDTLLWTACVEVHRGKVPPPPGVEDWWSLPPEWTAEKFEAKYGVGHYEDRKILLHDALNTLLKNGVEVEPVYRILGRGRFKLAQWYEMQNEFDDMRVVETERHTVLKNLQFWAGRMQRFLHLELDSNTMSVGPVARGLSHKKTQSPRRQEDPLAQLLDALMPHLHDNVLRHPPYPYRRPPRSGPPSPKTEILRPMLKALADAGVTGWVRTAFLEVTGLTRPHK